METKKLGRRAFIAGAAVLTAVSTVGHSVLSSSEHTVSTESLSIRIQLPKSVNYEEYVSIRNRKMNFSWYRNLEKDFKKAGKIASSKFVFAGNQFKIDYKFSSEISKQEFIDLLTQKYPIVSAKISRDELSLNFSDTV